MNDALNDMALARGRQSDSTFPKRLPQLPKWKCFICGSRQDVVDSVCSDCREDFPVRETK